MIREFNSYYLATEKINIIFWKLHLYWQLAGAVLFVLYGLMLLPVERRDTALSSNYPILNWVL